MVITTLTGRCLWDYTKGYVLHQINLHYTVSNLCFSASVNSNTYNKPQKIILTSNIKYKIDNCFSHVLHKDIQWHMCKLLKYNRLILYYIRIGLRLLKQHSRTTYMSSNWQHWHYMYIEVQLSARSIYYFLNYKVNLKTYINQYTNFIRHTYYRVQAMTMAKPLLRKKDFIFYL